MSSKAIAVIAVVVVLGIIGYFIVNGSNNPSLTQVVPSPTPSISIGEITPEPTSTSESPSVTNSVQVQISNFTYLPTPLTVKAGTTVTWTNNDSAPHDVTSLETGGILKSPRLTTGQSFSFTFTEPGTYNYYCTIHPTMKATIVVTP